MPHMCPMRDGMRNADNESESGATFQAAAQTHLHSAHNPRAEAVVTSACGYTQAEFTPANHLVVTQTSSRHTQVRFDNEHQVWHLVPSSTAEVDTDARWDRYCCPSENGTPSTPSDSQGGAVSSDKTAAFDGTQTARDEGVLLGSVTCDSPKRQLEDEVFVDKKDGARGYEHTQVSSSP